MFCYYQRAVPTDTTVFVVAFKSGLAQPCVATATVRGDTVVNIQLTALADLGEFQAPPPDGTRTVSGVVFEQTLQGRLPIDGAEVAFENLGTTPDAYTFTDNAGRYTLCGLPTGALWNIGAAKTGHTVTDIDVGAGRDSLTIDVELKRR